MKKAFLTLVILGAVVVGMPIVLFIAYGYSNNFDVGNALSHLVAAQPEPVESNEALVQAQKVNVTWTGDIDELDLAESSGLASSLIHPDLLWSINDSGGDAEIFGLDSRGGTRARMRLTNTELLDWEALDTFINSEGKATLIVADVGDNFRWRPYVELIFVQEPSDLTLLETQPDKKLVVRYPDGPRDCEAIAVDIARDRILLLSKRHDPPELYSVPLDAQGEVRATKVAELSGFPKPTHRDYYQYPSNARYRYMPSGMDVAGDRLLVTTYKPALLFDLADISAAPVLLPLPHLGQREAITFAQGSNNIAYISRERRDGTGSADLFRVEFSLVGDSPHTVAAPQASR